jgi:hypothetical protein
MVGLGHEAAPDIVIVFSTTTFAHHAMDCI